MVVDGSTGVLSSGEATWNLNVSKTMATSITIQDATGAKVGGQPFFWNGVGTDGSVRMALTAVASDASQQNVPVSIELQGRVESVDLTQNPLLLSIGGQTYTMDK